jgi:predicted HTH transcriptional regulator
MRSRNETRIDVSEGERKEIFLFDYECFREAWINACVHNAWRTSIPPMVLLFDDRIEIDSTGGIPFSMHLSEFYEGRSHPVNESLFRLSNMIGFTEHSGRGVPTIVGKYGRGSITVNDQSVRVTIPFAFTPSYVESRKNAKLNSQELTADEKAVMDMIRTDSAIKISDMADRLGTNASAVKRILADLKEKQMIVNEGTNRRSKWKVLI